MLHVYIVSLYCLVSTASFILCESQQVISFQWMEKFENEMLPETDTRYQVVKKVVYHLSESNQDIPQLSEFKWVIHVVEEPGINAFVLPVSKSKS